MVFHRPAGIYQPNTALKRAEISAEALGKAQPARNEPGNPNYPSAIRRTPCHRSVEQPNDLDPASPAEAPSPHAMRRGHAFVWLLCMLAFRGLTQTRKDHVPRHGSPNALMHTARGILPIRVHPQCQHNNPATATDICLLATRDVTCPVQTWQNYPEMQTPPKPHASPSTRVPSHCGIGSSASKRGSRPPS